MGVVPYLQQLLTCMTFVCMSILVVELLLSGVLRVVAASLFSHDAAIVRCLTGVWLVRSVFFAHLMRDRTIKAK